MVYRFTLYDDGKVIRPESWQVSWEETYVEVLLFGEEQSDVQVRLFYDGKTESESLPTQYGKRQEAAGSPGILREKRKKRFHGCQMIRRTPRMVSHKKIWSRICGS